MIAGRSRLIDVMASIDCFTSQTYPYKELIIVNNTANHFEASALSLQATRDVFIADVPFYLSAGMARNYGIRAANGQILAQFDPDYWYAPNRLEAQIATLADCQAHVCLLASTLNYSYASGRATYYNNQKRAILNTMVFSRPQSIDYPNWEKQEELGILDKMQKADMKIISIDRPELACHLIVTLGKKAQHPLNHGLKKVEFKTVIKLLKNRDVRSEQEIPLKIQLTSDDNNYIDPES